MAKSEAAKQVDLIQNCLRDTFKARGFRKRGRAYNRVADDSLVQVVQFFMGPHWGATHGTFAVEVGVFIPEVAEHHMRMAAPPAFVREYHCSIRANVQALRHGVEYEAWDTRAGPDVIGGVKHELDELGFPLLDEFSTRDRIVSRLLDRPEFEEGMAASTPPRIVCGIIHACRGEQQRAKQLFREQTAASSAHPAHAAYLRGLARRLGL